MAEEINEKSKKSDILEAYNEALREIQVLKSGSRQLRMDEDKKSEVTVKASAHSVDRIIKQLAEVKAEMVKAVDSLEGKLVEEFRRFSELKQAADLQAERIRQLHDIEVQADSLSALIHANNSHKIQFENEMRDQKDSFEAEMVEKQAVWKLEQADRDRKIREKEQELSKNRQREEEEYTYTLESTRKREQDEYNEKRASLEKSLEEKRVTVEKQLAELKHNTEKGLAERESALTAKENEFNALKKQAETFPARLEKAMKDAEKDALARVEKDMAHKIELVNREIEGERKLHEQIVKAHELKIKEQDSFIRDLSRKTDESARQVKDIAMRAVESVSGPRGSFRDSGQEQKSQ